ncbi:MAG: hypothetical protein CMB97_01490 [Flavobacteriaceae bacterium]|nr:hypothetical protein [Flavobacteriaceae bacterium]
MTKTKSLFLWVETPHLPDLGLTSEINFKQYHSLKYDKQNDLTSAGEQSKIFLMYFTSCLEIEVKRNRAK